MNTLNDKLSKKAESECISLYYKEMQKIVKDFMKTFNLTEREMKQNPFLLNFYQMQWSSGIGSEILKDLIPIYTENYINNFINKVEEMQEILEDHTH